jgi:LPXTG-site transpeptidase (sortase) family protein
MSASRTTRWLERCLWVTGLVLLAWVGYVWADGRSYQARAEAELDRAIAEARASDRAESPFTVRTAGGDPSHSPTRVDLPDELPGDEGGADTPTIGDGGVVGKLEIPRLGLSVMVSEGTSARVLRRGAGHLSNTPLPGANGNAAFAAHRDRHFRPLREINPGDDLVFTGIDGTYKYRVASTEIVEPHEVRVLAPTEEPSITLVTCFPFSYVGNAPKRFIVRAHQVGWDPGDEGATGGG